MDWTGDRGKKMDEKVDEIDSRLKDWDLMSKKKRGKKRIYTGCRCC